MELIQIVDTLEDINNRLRVHIMASPLDDIVEECVNALQDLLEELNEEL